MSSIVSRIRSWFPRQEPFDEVLFTVLQNCENQEMLRKCQSYENVKILVTFSKSFEVKTSVRYKDTVISFEVKLAGYGDRPGVVKTDEPRSWILFFHSDSQFQDFGAQAITEKLFYVLHPDTDLRVDFLANFPMHDLCNAFPNAFRSYYIFIGKKTITEEEWQYVVEKFTNLRGFKCTAKIPAAYAGVLDRHPRPEEAETQNLLE